MPWQVNQIKAALILTLYVSAAKAAASIDQAAELRRRVLPELERYRAREIDEPEVMDLVDEVMGEWEIPDDFAAYLGELGFNRNERGK